MHFARYETRRLLASENMPRYIEKPPQRGGVPMRPSRTVSRLLLTRRCSFVHTWLRVGGDMLVFLPSVVRPAWTGDRLIRRTYDSDSRARRRRRRRQVAGR